MNIFFGTDGWRAHIDTEINEETVSIAAQHLPILYTEIIKKNLPAWRWLTIPARIHNYLPLHLPKYYQAIEYRYYYPTGSPRHPYYLMPPYTLIAVPA